MGKKQLANLQGCPRAPGQGPKEKEKTPSGEQSHNQNATHSMNVNRVVEGSMAAKQEVNSASPREESKFVG